MNQIESLEQVHAEHIVLAAGAFDGLHLGHIAVIETAKRLAEQHDSNLGVLRFFPHPAKVLAPDTAPPLLGSEKTLISHLEDLGVNVHVRLPFSKEFAQIEPEDFLAQLLSALPGLKGMVVGSNWRFGHRGRGDLHLLRQWGSEHHIEIQQAEDTLHDDLLISSTRIREAVRKGKLETAHTLLGRPFRLNGVVQKGKQFGRDLGFPTANFLPEQECLPPEGVYVMRVHGQGLSALLGAGYITHGPRLVEVHLLDFSGDLYGKSISVDLLEFRRSASPIPDMDQLRQRIQLDVDSIRADYQT